MTVLLAGATGTLGRQLLAELQRRGERVRALVRSPARSVTLDPAPAEIAVADLVTGSVGLDSACRGIRTVVSAAGRSCSTRRLPERGGFHPVDYEGNRRLLEAAVRVGAERFLYVSVLGGQRLRGIEYVDAHEEFVELLRASPIDSTVVRANGFFAGYLELLGLVTSPGPATLIGDGQAKDNPIHEADLASVCLDALEGDEREVEVGGPEVLNRRQELELVCEIAGRHPRIVSVPPRLLRASGTAMRPFDARRAEVVKFLTAICVTDMIGPSVGQRRLSDYLSAAVATGAPKRTPTRAG
jgi:uncharacterized protein YbjT (DUF2867 family)